MYTAYISIGNSDDKLTQEEWSRFFHDISHAIGNYASTVHGEWLSAPQSRYQNACWCVVLDSLDDKKNLQELLAIIRKQYRQDSIAWADVPDTAFL